MYKKISIFITIFVLVFGVQFLQPKKAEAQGIPVYDNLNTLKEFGIDTLVTILQTRIINKLIDDTLNWAAGGFDGGPSLIYNWSEFIKGTQYDVISRTLQTAASVANQTQENINEQNEINLAGCEFDAYQLWEEELGYLEDGDSLLTETEIGAQLSSDLAACQTSASNIYGDLGVIAQSNYDSFQSGEATTARSAFNTVTNFGAKQLNIDALDSIIKGEGNTLKKLLGSQQRVNQFSNDITVGGWQGYIALADPHNYPSGLSSLITSALGQKTTNKVSQTIQDVQTPNKFLPSLICGDEGADDEGACIGRSILGTSAAQKQSQTDESLNSDLKQSRIARELSDVLAKALGRLTVGLFNKGFTALSRTGTSGTESQAENSANQFSGTYQSEYDVLGISDDASIFESGQDSFGGGGLGNTEGEQFDIFSTDFGSDGSAPYIGGPEDIKGTAWNEGPELVINLRDILEPAINNTQKELDFYTQMRAAVIAGQTDIINLDRCVPGPDNNWEKRYKDQIPITGDSDDAIKNKIGFNEMKTMVSDPRVNIPGAQAMQSLVRSSLGTGDEQLDLLNSNVSNKSNVLAVLKTIQSKIKTDFNIYKQSIHSNLFLFEAEWNQLSDAEKIELFGLRQLDGNGQPATSEQGDPLYLIDAYYLFKNDETPESVFEENPNIVKEALLTMAWDIWRTEKGLEPATPANITTNPITPAKPSGEKQKSNLRYRYYVLQNQISTELQVLEAELARDQIIEQNGRAKEFVDDCINFKSFVTGIPFEDIEESLKTNNFSISLSGVAAFGMLPTTTFINHSKGKVKILGVANAKTDPEIKSFLEGEYQKQINDLANGTSTSLFKKDILTSPGNIELSILGFETELDKETYLEQQYPTEGEGGGSPIPIPNPTSIADIYQFDYMTESFNRGGTGVKGLLYCRTVTTFDAHSGTSDPMIPSCVKSFYRASNLEYMVIFSGI